MSYTSVINAVQQAMAGELSQFRTIAQAEAIVPQLDASQMPALLLCEVPGQMVPLSGGYPGGWLQEQWDLECHVLNLYPDTTTPEAFRGLLAAVQAVFPARRYFHTGVADTETTRVLHVGLFKTTREVSWQGTAGGVLREGYVRARVLETIVG